MSQSWALILWRASKSLTTRRVSLPVPRVELRVIPTAKKSRDDDDVKIMASSSDIRLTIDDETERQLYTRLSDFWLRHYRVPQKMSHLVLSISLSIINDFQNSFNGTLSIKLAIKNYWVFHHTLTTLLHYLVKHKLSKLTKITIIHVERLFFNTMSY